MIKVLLVTASLRVGGLESVVMNCARFMPADKYSFDFLCWDENEGEFEIEAGNFGGKVIKIPSPRDGYYKFFKNVKKVIEKNGKYDIVHSHVFFLSGIVLSAARACGVKTRIAHSHSVQRKSDRGVIRKIYCSTMRKLINKNANIRCACSVATGNYLYGDKVFASSGIVLPNVVDLASYEFSEANRQLIRQEFGLSDDQIVVGNVGHLLPVKNQEFLLEVFSEYSQCNNAHLIIVGDGPERKKITNKIRELGMENKTILAGTRMDVCKIMSAIDIFVLPSLHEGLPLTVIEAMANGLYFVMEKQIIAKELSVFSNCIEVDGYTVSDWSEGISKGIQNGRRDSRLCIRELSLFSIEHFREVLEKMYTK